MYDLSLFCSNNDKVSSMCLEQGVVHRNDGCKHIETGVDRLTGDSLFKLRFICMREWKPNVSVA